MARIRSIKPEFFTSGQLVECSTNARLLFVGTWVFADDKGRHKLNFKTLKMEVFPGDPFTADDVEAMFRELWAADLVTVYEVKGSRFFVVNGWHHQKIDRPQEPRCPSPCEGSVVSYSTNARRTLDEHSLTDTIRSEGYDTKDRIGSDRIAEEKHEPSRAVPGRRFAAKESTAAIPNAEALASVRIEPLPKDDIRNGNAIASTPKAIDSYAEMTEWWRKHLSSDAPLTGDTALDLLQVLCLATETTRKGRKVEKPVAWFNARLVDGSWLGSSTNVHKIRDWLNDEINAGRVTLVKQEQVTA
jgi:hypothetical protein